MRIGELADKAGCRTETVRYYEREGLLPEPGRTGGNYRSYDAGHLARLVFIRNCRALEMSLDEIRALLAIKDAGGPDCEPVNAVLEAHIGHVTERIRRLVALKKQLAGLRRRCGGLDAVERCGILRELTASGGAAPAEGASSAAVPCPLDAGTVCGRKR